MYVCAYVCVCACVCACVYVCVTLSHLNTTVSCPTYVRVSHMSHVRHVGDAQMKCPQCISERAYKRERDREREQEREETGEREKETNRAQ